ncbi:MAG: nucleoside hydrolase [Eubacteriales bacterium]|nr:nucleoside hydrolase [Eubacteriales bacterium]
MRQRRRRASIQTSFHAVDEFVLVTTGPLTNWGWIFKNYPEIIPKVAGIYSMGGSLSGGNVSPYAEANYYDDPAALAIVLETRIPFHMISLDLTRQFYFQAEELRTLQTWAQEPEKGGRATLRRLSAKMYLDYASKDSALHDPLALLAFFDPEALEAQWTTISCHQTGEREGEVYRDPAGFPACIYGLRKRDALMEKLLSSIEMLGQ